MKLFLGGEVERFTLIDDEDFSLVRGQKWCLHSAGYACTNVKNDQGKQVILLLHRFLLGATKGQCVDHINRDRLDNRRENLRLVTHQQNMWNIGFNKKNTSGFRGVSFEKRTNKWVAKIKLNDHTFFLGRHPTAEIQVFRHP